MVRYCVQWRHVFYSIGIYNTVTITIHREFCDIKTVTAILRHREKNFLWKCILYLYFFFNLTPRFVFEKYWLVLMFTRVINKTGHPALSRCHPALSRSHHVRLPPFSPQNHPSDWQIKLPLRGRPIMLITLKITDRIGLHSVLLPLIIWEKPMNFFSVM